MKFEDPTRSGDPSTFSESGVIDVTSEVWSELQGGLVSKVTLPAGATQWVIFVGGAIQDFEWVDLLVTHAVQRGLGVVIDLHGFSEFMRDPVEERARFVALWRQVAGHYASMPTNVVFELLNEPFGLPPDTDDALNQAYGEALAAIRSSGGANVERLVLLSPAERSGSVPHEAHWQRLETLRFPADDPHVGATVHNYDPFLFTHQGTERRTVNGVGIGWTDPAETSTRGIRFPGPPDVAVPADPRVTAAWALGWLVAYNDRARSGCPGILPSCCALKPGGESRAPAFWKCPRCDGVRRSGDVRGGKLRGNEQHAMERDLVRAWGFGSGDAGAGTAGFALPGVDPGLPEVAGSG
jgi:hypothetical protein